MNGDGRHGRDLPPPAAEDRVEVPGSEPPPPDADERVEVSRSWVALVPWAVVLVALAVVALVVLG